MKSTGSFAAWAIAHLPGAPGYYAGRCPSQVTVVDQVLPESASSVSLRCYSTRRTAGDEPYRAAIVYFPPSSEFERRRSRTADWLCGEVSHRLDTLVVRVEVGGATSDHVAAGYAAVRWVAHGHPSAQLAVLGARDGGSLAARVAMLARDEHDHSAVVPGAPTNSLAAADDPNRRAQSNPPHLERQALISPDFTLLAGPPVTADALSVSLVARLSDLPATLLQRPVASAAALGGENLAALLREAGVAVREIEYPESALTWASYPRAAGHSGRALDDLVAFLRRGLIDDGFDVVPAWNVH